MISPDLKNLIRPIQGLSPDSKNARFHSPKNLKAIEASLRQFGQQKPISVTEDGTVIAGNGTLAAAKSLGWNEIAVTVFRGTQEEAKAYAIADNRSAELASWDFEELSAQMESLVNFDLGFDEKEIERMMRDANKALGVDRTEEHVPVPAKPTSKRGQIFQLGKHRLMCGDSTDAKDVAQLMKGKKALLMNTDPPYGINYVANAKSKGQSKKSEDIEGDELDGAELQKFLEAAIKAAVPYLTDNAAFYLWHPMLTQGTFFAAAAAADILISRQIIWVKPSLVFGRGDYHWRHELAFYGWRRGHRPVFYGNRNQTTIWEAGRENDKIHPTQKPLALFEIPILNHTRKRELIYEPFGGSGSQFIAAEKLDRVCYGMELSEAYCDVIIKRWEQYTTHKATLIKSDKA